MNIELHSPVNARFERLDLLDVNPKTGCAVYTVRDQRYPTRVVKVCDTYTKTPNRA